MSIAGLELADAEKGCSNGEGHLSVLRRIAEKLSSDSVAKDLHLGQANFALISLHRYQPWWNVRQ